MLSGKPVFILDCDDVVCRCLNQMAKEANEKLGTNFTDENILTWDFHDHAGGGEDLKAYIQGKMSEKGWCANLEPFPGAVEGVTRLKEVAEVFFCTSPFMGEHWPHERRVWLQEKFSMHHDHIIQTEAKFLVRGDVFIDDKIDHLHAWDKYGQKNGIRGLACLWVRPANRGHAMAKAFPWLESWEQVYKLAGVVGSGR